MVLDVVSFFQAQLEEEAGGGLVRLVGELNPDDLYGEECFLEVT